MSSQLKVIIEKYCAVAGKNVAFELSGRSGGARCLNDACRREHGGCKNELFTTAQENGRA